MKKCLLVSLFTLIGSSVLMASDSQKMVLSPSQSSNAAKDLKKRIVSLPEPENPLALADSLKLDDTSKFRFFHIWSKLSVVNRLLVEQHLRSGSFQEAINTIASEISWCQQVLPQDDFSMWLTAVNKKVPSADRLSALNTVRDIVTKYKPSLEKMIQSDDKLIRQILAGKSDLLSQVSPNGRARLQEMMAQETQRRIAVEDDELIKQMLRTAKNTGSTDPELFLLLSKDGQKRYTDLRQSQK